ADVIKTAAVIREPAWCLTMPWAPLQRRAEVKEIDVFSMLNVRDLISSYSLSLKATRALARRNGTSNWVLQSYTALRWFAVWKALEKLDGSFVIAEHFD